MKVDSQNMQNESIDIIKLIWKWKLQLTAVFVIAVIISSIIALNMTSEYSAAAIMYPAKNNTLVLNDENARSQSSTRFGGEMEAEQMIQLATSAEIRDKISEKYDLFNRYQLDSTSATKNSDLIRNYDDHVSCKRTRFGSVRIKAFDRDPQVAADIANDITALIDSVKNRMIRERSVVEFESLNRRYLRLESEISAWRDSISKFMELGVEPSEVKGQMYRVLASTNDPKVRAEILSRIKMTDKFAVKLSSFYSSLDLCYGQRGMVVNLLEQAKINVSLAMSHKFIVDKARPSDRKARPVRWIIVASASFISVFLAFMLILVLAKIRELKA